MNKRWRNIGLTALLVLAIVVIAPAFLSGGNTQQEARTMRYSDFVEAVEENQISRVLISPDRGTAQVVENDGRRAQVNVTTLEGTGLVEKRCSPLEGPGGARDSLHLCRVRERRRGEEYDEEQSSRRTVWLHRGCSLILAIFSKILQEPDLLTPQ